MKVKYTEWHNNYPFTLGEEYNAYRYKRGWVQIDGQLYREECFKEITE